MKLNSEKSTEAASSRFSSSWTRSAASLMVKAEGGTCADEDEEGKCGAAGV